MNSLKQNYDKHLVVTAIVLVALPILLVYSHYTILAYDRGEVTQFFIEFLNNPIIGTDIAEEFRVLLAYIEYTIFVIMLILYPVYPSIFSIEEHISKRNPKGALTEYQMLKKIVFTLFPLSIFTIALSISSAIIQDNNPLVTLIRSLPEPAQSLFVSILGAILFIVVSALLRLILSNRSKPFKFYLARLSFRAMSRVENEGERMKYLIWGLSFYNEYIRRTLRLEINDLELIYSKIIADAGVDIDRSINELCRAFEDDDKLRPIRCMTGLFDVVDPARFLVKESLSKKLKEWGTIIITLASATAGVVGSIVTLYKPAPTT